jgi:glycosyltransferase involved in cell wall biosynthesis
MRVQIKCIFSTEPTRKSCNRLRLDCSHQIVVSSKRLSILFTSGWYPSKAHNTLGNFVQRHAEAVATRCDVWVLYVASMPQWQGPPKIEEHSEKNVHTVIVYCKPGFFAKRKAFMKGVYHLIRSKKIQFDIVHHNVLWPHGWQPRWLHSKFNLPYIVTEHWTGYDPINANKRNPLLLWMSKFGARKASFLCPVTHDLQQKMIDFGIHGRYQVVPNVVDTRLFALAKPDNKLVRFLHVSSLVDAHKNISGILRVWKTVSDRLPNIHLTLGGDGPVEYWKNQAQRLGIRPESIDFFGETTWEGVAQKMESSHALLLFSNYENLPCVIVEALTCGLPVISTRVGGISEHISSERGILVERGDEDALQHAIETLAGDIHSYNQTALRTYALERFSNEAVAEAFEKVYRVVVK